MIISKGDQKATSLCKEGKPTNTRPSCQQSQWNPPLSLSLSLSPAGEIQGCQSGALARVAATVKGRFLGACLLLLAAAAAVLAHGEGEEGKRGVRLLDAGRLEKFVDELPDMPLLRGYGVGEGGNLVAGELAVGMYDTTWKFHRDLPATRVFAYGASRETATHTPLHICK
ncbi:multicopper oxidase LPR1 homolog 2-like [Aegilops tauschii subsp. strangulata]|uniref:multicopper oxidase LPR1 homolog 2-like n=1 Tax=Aegilops tauschii subsp. strangulata TaxID=200361 RepID=UPI003CC85137